MDHVCQKCGAVNENVDLQERETEKSLMESTTSTAPCVTETGEETSQVLNVEETVVFKETYWACRACGKDHTIDLEKLEGS